MLLTKQLKSLWEPSGALEHPILLDAVLFPVLIDRIPEPYYDHGVFGLDALSGCRVVAHRPPGRASPFPPRNDLEKNSTRSILKPIFRSSIVEQRAVKHVSKSSQGVRVLTLTVSSRSFPLSSSLLTPLNGNLVAVTNPVRDGDHFPQLSVCVELL